MTDAKVKLENWVPFPRKISTDFRNGSITLNEMIVYIWLRLNANPFGISTTSLSGISQDLFKGKKTDNAVNKILLALKRKKYLYYQKRTGSRGSFDVHFGEFMLPNKHIASIEKFFEKEKRRGSSTKQSRGSAEPRQNSSVLEQNLKQLNTQVKSLVSNFSVDDSGRTYNIDNDNNNKYLSIEAIKDKTILSKFKPRNLDEELCLNIATYLREKHINFVLSIYNEYGRTFLEKVWRIFKEHELRTHIDNRGAYFNALINRISNNQNI